MHGVGSRRRHRCRRRHWQRGATRPTVTGPLTANGSTFPSFKPMTNSVWPALSDAVVKFMMLQTELTLPRKLFSVALDRRVTSFMAGSQGWLGCSFIS